MLVRLTGRPGQRIGWPSRARPLSSSTIWALRSVLFTTATSVSSSESDNISSSPTLKERLKEGKAEQSSLAQGGLLGLFELGFFPGKVDGLPVCV